MSKIGDFITECGKFFLATVEGDKPHIRPLGAFLDIDGKIIFGVGNFKDVYKQMVANPYVEIVACKNDGHWLRYSGKVVWDFDPKYAEMFFEKIPHLRNIYNEKTNYKLMNFHLEEAKALDIHIMGKGEDLLD